MSHCERRSSRTCPTSSASIVDTPPASARSGDGRGRSTQANAGCSTHVRADLFGVTTTLATTTVAKPGVVAVFNGRKEDEFGHRAEAGGDQHHSSTRTPGDAREGRRGSQIHVVDLAGFQPVGRRPARVLPRRP